MMVVVVRYAYNYDYLFRNRNITISRGWYSNPLKHVFTFHMLTKPSLTYDMYVQVYT